MAGDCIGRSRVGHSRAVGPTLAARRCFRHYVRVMVAPTLGGALGVSSQTAQTLVDMAVQRALPARTYLCFEGDESTHLYFVESGLLRIDRVTDTGRNVLFELATPGDLIGELGVVDGSPRSASVSTVEDTTVLAIRADDFMSVMRSETELSMAVLQRVIIRMRALSDQLVEVTAQSAASRVAARLMNLIDHAGFSQAPFEMPLPITQEELGQWAGLSREGVVKGLAELRSGGALDTGRRRIIVHDLDLIRHASIQG